MSSAVLQIVVLRDGLLVGTEVFPPGAYALGSAPGSDLKLDDPDVGALSGKLYFQNGKVVLQSQGAQPLYVNGHRISACEIRPMDEIVCGPFTLKVRLLNQAPKEDGLPPEVAALLGVKQANAPAPQVAPARTAAPPPPPAARPVPPPAAAPAPASARPGPLRPSLPVPVNFQETVPARAAPAAFAPNATQAAFQAPSFAAAITDSGRTEPITMPSGIPAFTDPSGEPPALGTQPSARSLAQANVQAQVKPSPAPPPPPRAPAPPPVSVAPASSAPAAAAARAAPRPAPSEERAPPARALAEVKPPAQPSAASAAAPRRIYLSLYWGEALSESRSFPVSFTRITGAAKDATGADATMPLWGFGVDAPLPLVEAKDGRLFLRVPPGAHGERGQRGDFLPAVGDALEFSEESWARISNGQMCLVARVAPEARPERVSPFSSAPLLVLALFFLLAGGFIALLKLAPEGRELPDLKGKELPAVAIRLMLPEKKSEKAKDYAKKKLEAANKAQNKPKKREEPQPKAVAKAQPAKTIAAGSPALAALAKLTAGPAATDIFAAADKASAKGKGGGGTTLKALGSLAPVGKGTAVLGGGFSGGTLGGELLRGKGGSGIGALGARGIGQGSVGGTVQRASARTVSVQGSIDKDAVAKVVNSHLQEVRACYERALLKEPGLAGKVVLEWTIGTSGKVTAAKMKTTTLRNSGVEGCILKDLKTWTFPTPKGGSVIVSYPFLFNSVGY